MLTGVLEKEKNYLKKVGERMELRAKGDRTRESTIMPLVAVPQTWQALTYRHAFALGRLAAPLSAKPHSPFKVQLTYRTAFLIPVGRISYFCICVLLTPNVPFGSGSKWVVDR